jgi:mannose-6-phosphate isomerase
LIEIRQAFQLIPQYREYVWGGDRLRPGHSPTAEAWVVYEGDEITNGSLAGMTLAEATRQYGAGLLGRRVLERTGRRFPLLIKLLDCAEWLSLQVHPNDEQAAHLEGAGHFGKTEAWHILDADEGAELLGGLKPGQSASEVREAIRAGQPLVDCMQRLPVQAGDSIFIPAGMIHALGPGILLYEIQQTSDITYRVYDWDRPASAGRQLHVEQSLQVADPALTGKLIPPQPLADGEKQTLITSPYFNLALYEGDKNSLLADTGQESFHAVTVIAGRATIQGDGWELALERFQSAVVPALVGAYRITPAGKTRALLASVEAG